MFAGPPSKRLQQSVLRFCQTEPRKQQVGSKNKLVHRDGKCVISENVDILIMASFLGLLSLLEFWALMLPCQKYFHPSHSAHYAQRPGTNSPIPPLLRH